MQAYINENTCPELLVFETDLVERVTAQMHFQALQLCCAGSIPWCCPQVSSYVQEQKVQDLDKHPDTALQRCMYLTELDRVKFALRCYYRTRLRKVCKTACVSQCRYQSSLSADRGLRHEPAGRRRDDGHRPHAHAPVPQGADFCSGQHSWLIWCSISTCRASPAGVLCGLRHTHAGEHPGPAA